MSDRLCYVCATRIDSLPLEDRGFTADCHGSREPVCRDCLREWVVSILSAPNVEMAMPDSALMEPHFASVILEAYSEVQPA